MKKQGSKNILPYGYIAELATEFDCSRTTIYEALRGIRNSAKAHRIRKRHTEIIENELTQ